VTGREKMDGITRRTAIRARRRPGLPWTIVSTPALILLPVLLILLVGCDGPLGLPFTNVKRPDYNNPVDPESRVLLSEILPFIPDPDFRSAIQNTGAIYNTDVRYLNVTLSTASPSIAGIQYIPALDFLYIQATSGALDFVPMTGHARLNRLEVDGLNTASIRSIPNLASLRSLAVRGAFETFSLGDISTVGIEELDVSNSSPTSFFTTLNGIGKFSRLQRLNIINTSVPSSELSTELTNVASTLRELRVDDPEVYDFIGLYPVLDFIGFDITTAVGLDHPTLAASNMLQIASNGPFRGLGFYSIGPDFASLTNLTGSGITELELAYATAPNIDVSEVSSLALRRLDVSNASAIANIVLLPFNLEEVRLVGSQVGDAELTGIAQNLPNLRHLDLSDTSTPVAFTTLLPISQNSVNMQRLEEIRVVNAINIPADSFTNGIPELSVLPNVRYMDVSGTGAAADPVASGINDLITATNGRVFVEY